MIMEVECIFSIIKVILITIYTACMITSLTICTCSAKKTIAIGVFSCKNSIVPSLFNFIMQINFSLLILSIASLLNTAMDGNTYTDLLLCTAFYISTIFLENKFLKKPFRQFTAVITSGWGILLLIPIFFCILIIFVAVAAVQFTTILYIFTIVVPMLIVYAVLFQSLMRQYHLQILKRDNNILEVQISAMNKHSEDIFAAEEKLKILNHDTRHFAKLMQANLQHGNLIEVENILSNFNSTLKHSKTSFYCNNHMINSTLIYYIEQAKKFDIDVHVSFSAPIHVDAIAFSIMLANALENAIVACKSEEKDRSIELKSRIFNNQYILELTNTCLAILLFDKEGIPLSNKGERHGIGTRSILDFAKKQNAMVNFETKDGRFIFQMMITLEDRNVLIS